jgi:hypothetical protein
MRSALVLLGIAAVGCHGGGDENLGLGDKGARAIDVAGLTRPAELMRALSLTGPAIDALLGAHHMRAASTLKLELPSGTQQLDEVFDVASDGKQAVRLLHDNSRDYGFEAIAVGNQLWVKPRYGKWVQRKIEGDELDRLRTTAETPAASYLRLLAPWLSVREAGNAQVAGRPAIKLALSANPSPDGKPPAGEPGKRWRQSVKVRYVSGDIVVDAHSGAPLMVTLDASYTFERDGKPVGATLALKQVTTTDPGAITPPSDAVTLSRPRPMLDRQQLLEGLPGVR